MSDKEKLKRKDATHFIDELIVYKVDLVKNPATGDKFLTVRGSDEEILGRALDPQEMDEVKEALLSTGDINVVRLGKAEESSNSDAEEVNREKDLEQESEMATKESKLIPKEEAKRDDPKVEDPKVEEKPTEETPVEEESKREETPEDTTPPTVAKEDTPSKSTKVEVNVDMTRTEEAVSKIVDSVDVIAGNVDKMIERTEKTDDSITKLGETVEKLSSRVEELERSSEVTNSLPDDEGEPTLEDSKRSDEDKPSFWGSVL